MAGLAGWGCLLFSLLTGEVLTGRVIRYGKYTVQLTDDISGSILVFKTAMAHATLVR